MVLGIALITALTVSRFGPVVSPARSAEMVHDEAIVADRQLKLSEADGECILKIAPKDGAIALGVGVPCWFQRMNGTVMIESFPEFSVDRVFAVIGTPVDAETRKSFGLDADTVCATKAQGLVVDKGEVVAVQHVADGGVWCRDKGVDRKRFWDFAENYRGNR